MSMTQDLRKSRLSARPSSPRLPSQSQSLSQSDLDKRCESFDLLLDFLFFKKFHTCVVQCVDVQHSIIFVVVRSPERPPFSEKRDADDRFDVFTRVYFIVSEMINTLRVGTFELPEICVYHL